VGNDNAYIFWQAVWPSTLTTAKDQSADQQGLLYADNPGAADIDMGFPERMDLQRFVLCAEAVQLLREAWVHSI